MGIMNVVVVGTGITAKESFVSRAHPYWETERPVHELVAEMAVTMANLCGTAQFEISVHEIDS